MMNVVHIIFSMTHTIILLKKMYHVWWSLNKLKSVLTRNSSDNAFKFSCVLFKKLFIQSSLKISSSILIWYRFWTLNLDFFQLYMFLCYVNRQTRTQTANSQIFFIQKTTKSVILEKIYIWKSDSKWILFLTTYG